MALADLTKQLAEQAIRSATTSKPAPSPTPETAGAAIVGQLQAMQKALKEDEELVISCHAGGETLRVLEMFWPSWQVAVLTGTDAQHNRARVISPVSALQLVCRVAKTATKPQRIRIVSPPAA